MWPEEGVSSWCRVSLFFLFACFCLTDVYWLFREWLVYFGREERSGSYRRASTEFILHRVFFRLKGKHLLTLRDCANLWRCGFSAVTAVCCQQWAPERRARVRSGKNDVTNLDQTNALLEVKGFLYFLFLLVLYVDMVLDQFPIKIHSLTFVNVNARADTSQARCSRTAAAPLVCPSPLTHIECIVCQPQRWS